MNVTDSRINMTVQLIYNNNYLQQLVNTAWSFWQAAGHPFLINSPQQLREASKLDISSWKYIPITRNNNFICVLISSFTKIIENEVIFILLLFKVLFEELRLDQMCKKKLARTSVKNHKSTSEAVVII